MEFTIKVETLGDAIKYKRTALGLTQRKLAAKVGVDVTYICRMENNAANPTANILRDLEIVLEYPAGTLFQISGRSSLEALNLSPGFLNLLDKCIKKYGCESVEQRLRNLLGVQNGNTI